MGSCALLRRGACAHHSTTDRPVSLNARTPGAPTSPFGVSGVLAFIFPSKISRAAPYVRRMTLARALSFAFVALVVGCAPVISRPGAQSGDMAVDNGGGAAAAPAAAATTWAAPAATARPARPAARSAPPRATATACAAAPPTSTAAASGRRPSPARRRRSARAAPARPRARSQCMLGATYCSGAGFRTCIGAATGCNDWSPTVTACPNGQVCSGGACVAACTDRCAPGATQCSGSGVQTCELKATGCRDWSDPVPCSGGKVCSGGNCVTSCSDQCAAGRQALRRLRLAADVRRASVRLPRLVARAALPRRRHVHRQPVHHVHQRRQALQRHRRHRAMRQRRLDADRVVRVRLLGRHVHQHRQLHARRLSLQRQRRRDLQLGRARRGCGRRTAASPAAPACAPAAARRARIAATAATSRPATPAAPRGACRRCAARPAATPRRRRACLSSLTISTDTTMEGTVVVAGAVEVMANAKLITNTGLTIRAKTITVDQGGTIQANPSGTGTPGDATAPPSYGGCGGGYAAPAATRTAPTARAAPRSAAPPTPPSRAADAAAIPSSGAAGGLGGGVLQLIASDSISRRRPRLRRRRARRHQRQLRRRAPAPAAASCSRRTTSPSSAPASSRPRARPASPPASATASAAPALPAASRSSTARRSRPTARSPARSPRASCRRSSSRRRRIPIRRSPTTTASTRSRSRGTSRIRRASATTCSSITRSTTRRRRPTAAPSRPTSSTRSIRRSSSSGANYFHVVTEDNMSNIGLVESTFRININTAAPNLTSSTHTPGTWSTNHNPYFTWSMPTADSNYQGVRYVLDHFANTTPTQVTGTFIPTTQQKLQLSNLDDGIWVLHMVTVDQQGYQTKAVAHYQAWIATTTPMNGTANGQISWINGGTAQTIAGATVTLNRGLFTSTATASDGKYNLTNVPAGTWEATASAPGFESGDQDDRRHGQHGDDDRFPTDQDVVGFAAWLPSRILRPPRFADLLAARGSRRRRSRAHLDALTPDERVRADDQLAGKGRRSASGTLCADAPPFTIEEIILPGRTGAVGWAQLDGDVHHLDKRFVRQGGVDHRLQPRHRHRRLVRRPRLLHDAAGAGPRQANPVRLHRAAVDAAPGLAAHEPNTKGTASSSTAT